MKVTALNLQGVILGLRGYWGIYGCMIGNPYDVEKGSGTINPKTFYRC